MWSNTQWAPTFSFMRWRSPCPSCCRRLTSGESWLTTPQRAKPEWCSNKQSRSSPPTRISSSSRARGSLAHQLPSLWPKLDRPIPGLWRSVRISCPSKLARQSQFADTAWHLAATKRLHKFLVTCIGAASGFNRGQAEARSDLQAGRPLPAAHSHRRGDCGVAARPGESWEISLAHSTPGATALQGRGGGARQQDGAHGLGVDGPRRHLSGAGACGSCLKGLGEGATRRGKRVHELQG